MKPSDDRAQLDPSPSELYYERLFASLEPGEAAAAASTSAAAPAHEPTAFGRYRVVSRLGAGGQATAYLAFHPDLNREVAIKALDARLATAADAGRLRREAQLLAALDHPGLALVHDLDVADGRPFLVLEYIRGRSLRQLTAEAPIAPRDAARIVAAAARAVDHAHGRGVVHRDLKPDNILVEDGDRTAPWRIKVIDFGIAQLRDAWTADMETPGTISGTLEFMAPEQARGETARIGPRSDVFALGGVLYFLLTGRPPFQGASSQEVIARARRCEIDLTPLRRPGISRRLESLCRWALSAEPEDRPPGAGAFAAALESLSRRSSSVAGAAAAMAAAVLCLGAVWWWRAPGEPTAAAAGASLRLEVHRGGAFQSLIDALPLCAGDGLRVRVELPVGSQAHVGLFWLDTEGKLTVLAPCSKTVVNGRCLLEWPDPAEDDVVDVVGPSGTEVIFALVADGGAGATSLAAALAGHGPWPELPPDNALRLERDRVEEVRTRGPGEGRKVEAAWSQHAEVWRRDVAARCRQAVGWAIPHREAP